VSPLLRGVGPEVQGEAWATAMHRDIARALLGFRTLSPTDVSTILFHAVAAQDWPAIAHLSFGIVRSDSDTWQALAQSADWFVLVGTGEAKRPEADAVSLFFIRLFQFRLAAANHDEDAVASILACVDEELDETVASTPLRLARHLFLGQVLLRSEVNLPIARLVSMGLEYIRLSDELKDILAEVHTAEFDRAMTGPDGEPDLAVVGGSALVPHLTDRLSLTDFWRRVNRCPMLPAVSSGSLEAENRWRRLSSIASGWPRSKSCPPNGWHTARSLSEHTRLAGVARCRVWHRERRERLCGWSTRT